MPATTAQALPEHALAHIQSHRSELLCSVHHKLPLRMAAASGWLHAEDHVLSWQQFLQLAHSLNLTERQFLLRLKQEAELGTKLVPTCAVFCLPVDSA